MKKIKLKHFVISLTLLCLVILSASTAFAASDDTALSEVSDDITIGESDLSVLETGIPNLDGAVLSASNDAVLSDMDNNVVTNDTFFNYFDDEGNLKNVTFSELVFEGDFSNIDVNYITINKPIKFEGNAEFYGVTFVIDSDNVVIDGFTVTQTSDVFAFTATGVSDVTLSNNRIDYTALDGSESYAVYACSVENFNFLNNTVYFVGNTDGTVVNNAVRIEGDDDEDDPVPASNIVVSGNTFDVQMPSVDVGYDPDTYAATVMNDPIVFYYVDGLMFVDNVVNLKYNNATSAWGYDTIYAVSVRSDAYTFGEVQSKNTVIANNTINAEGHSCIYAVYVCADDFEVSGNNIYSAADSYLAHGIDIDGPSATGLVSNNTVIVVAPGSAYGIYSYQYMGAIEDIVYSGNVINTTAYASAAMEIVECNPEIIANEIIANGNYTYGIVVSIRDDGIIENNSIVVLGSNDGSQPTGDSLLPKNSMAISVKGDSLIKNNDIYSTNIGIKLVEDGEITIMDNTIDVEANVLFDSYGIYSHGLSNLNVIDNSITFVGNTNGTVVNNAVRIEGDDDEDDPVPASNIVVSGNTFDVQMPSVDVGYDPDTYAATVMNDPIVFYYVDGLTFVDNIVDLKYNNATSAWGYDTIYAVSVRSDAYTFGEVQSKNTVIANNTINAEGHSCIYAVYVCADDFEVSGNNIYSTADSYLAHGIDIDGPSATGLVSNNTVIVVAPGSAYGIYSYQYMGAIEDIVYSGNVINTTAYASAAMEIVECNPEIIANEIIANGNYTYGIVVSIRDDGIIENNSVVVLGSNEGSQPTGDSLLPKNSMAVSVKGDSLIKNNDIYSTNIGINLVESGDIVIDNNSISVEANQESMNNSGIVIQKPIDKLTAINNIVITNGEYAVIVGDTEGSVNNNYLVSEKFLGDDSVYIDGAATAYDNAPLLVSDLYKSYKDGQTLNVTALDEYGSPMDNVTLIATIKSVQYEATTDDTGLAQFDINNLTPGNYIASIRFKNGNGANATAKITVTKSDTVISAPDVKVAYKDPSGEVVATIVNEHGKPLVVNLNIEFNGETYNVRTDSNGQASIPIGNVTPGTYTATISYKGSSNYRASTATAKVTVTKSDTVMSASDVNIAYKDPNGELVATITNEHGKPLVVNLNVELNGKNYTVRTDSNGQATLSIATLTPGTYTATISYKGSSNYRASTATAKVTVTKSDTVISAPDVNIAYKDPNGELVATIVNEHGKPLVVTLNIELNGKTYNVRTDSNGQARLSLDTLTPGNYTATISYKGSGNYEASTATAQVVVVKSDTVLSAPDVEVAYKDPNGKLVSTITNEHGKPLVVSLNVKLNGKTYTVRTDSNGQMNVSTANLDPGTYTATISYKGSKNYNPTNTTANITVKP